jgi:hypothetical protein
MKKLLFVILLAVFFGCEKESTTGTIRFTNTSDNPYFCYIDNVYQTTLSGHTFTTYSINEGYHKVKALQVSGYLFFPTEVETTVSVFSDQEVEFIFPQDYSVSMQIV